MPKKSVSEKSAKTETVHEIIKAPRIETATFCIKGVSPLVIHRMSQKYKNEMRQKMLEGNSAKSKKKREPVVLEDIFEAARYRASKGWDGLHAGAVRNALISACKLVNFKMTLAKLSIFVMEDGWDTTEPQIPLIRIYGTPIQQDVSALP